MRRSVRLRRCIAAALLAAVGGLQSGCGTSRAGPPPAPGPQQLATSDAERFLTADVAADGRVVRHDQGGDTVSEGQAYGMLLALATDDLSTFRLIWRWTAAHMQLPDGLFGWHWTAGSLDRTPAADADTLIAWALDLAGARWRNPGWTVQARRVATAVATTEVGYDDSGAPTLAAGPWAVAAGKPVTVEPGYWAFPAYAALAALTGDHRWQALSGSDLSHLQQLTDGGARLPSDWAQLGNGATIAPAPAAGQTTTHSGQDGARALVWADCSDDSGLGSGWWRLIGPTAARAPLTRALDGSPASTDKSPLSAVAAAAVAKAAGQTATATRLLGDADQIARTYPTYYGSAWTALGRVLLTTTSLTAACAD